MKSRLIALDIDGTILDRPTGIPVPAAVREAIRDARKGGARVCLCSSRPCYFMEDATDELDEIDALIGSSGAEIQIADAVEIKKETDADKHIFKQVYTDTLTMPLIHACIEIAREWDIYVSFAATEKILARRIGPVDPVYAADPSFAFMDEDSLLETLKTEPVSCAYIITETDAQTESIVNTPALSISTVNRASKNSLVITNQGVDKGSGVLHLAEHWDIPHEAILAIGNDENDIPMLKAAGVGVAVANANPDVLAVADWIAPDVKDAGAAEAIRRFAL
jgi:Cof subfamily protein (haloacid dehalogenase superfamily)